MDGRTRRALPGIIKTLDRMIVKEPDEGIRKELISARQAISSAFGLASWLAGEKPQPSTATVRTAPSTEGVGQGEAA